jgi:hypothetical protein
MTRKKTPQPLTVTIDGVSYPVTGPTLTIDETMGGWPVYCKRTVYDVTDPQNPKLVEIRQFQRVDER